MRSAHDAGVPIYVGTDAGGTIEHGLAAQEMLQLRSVGLSPMEVLRARSNLRELLSPTLVILRGRVIHR